MQDDLRAELIKQFPSEVIETKDMTGKEYYACPTCKRAVATGTEKCQGCGQKLSWDNIRHENEAKGSKKAKIEFDVPADFALEDCIVLYRKKWGRKCLRVSTADERKLQAGIIIMKYQSERKHTWHQNSTR